MKIAPSILAADLADLAGALRVCEAGGADLVHVDVMDGHFVPNLTFGFPVLAALARHTRLPLDVHLMVREPGRLLDRYLETKPARVAFHWEAEPHVDRFVEAIHDGGALAGIALNPATPVEVLEDILPRLDFVLLMSVNPGFSGQAFLPYSTAKARRLKQMILRRGLTVEITVDGGVGERNIRELALAGVDIAVAGSSVFQAANPQAAIQSLRHTAQLETV